MGLFNWKTKAKFMDWKDYKAQIQIIDNFGFQQKVRNNNVRNL